MATRKLAEFVYKTSFEDIPQEVREHSKLVFLDWLGAALAGSGEGIASVMLRFIDDIDGKNGPDQATIIGKNVKTDMLKAALINGSMSHALDIDDYHGPTLCHPTVTFLPGILALSQQNHLEGKDIITAMTVAFDILVRVGYGAKRIHYDRGWHATSTLGKFGATAGAGKLLKLDVDGLINAFGIAGTVAGGVRQVFGTMGKPFHAGKASMDGLLAALLAQSGFQCSKEIIEGENGFMTLFSDDPDLDTMLDQLGEYYYLPTVSFKPYASCGGTHSTIDMMKELREKNNINVDDVKEIRIDAGKIALDAAGKVAPKTGLEGKFSTYYCAAVALAEGAASPDKFTDEKVNDPRLVALRQKVKISVPEPDLGFALRAVIQMKDGTEYSASTDAPRGDPANPISYDELAEKFRGLTKNVISEANVEQLIDKIKTLDRVSDIETLLDLCS
ncbi:MAG: MmgE/PrpD family protein [Syntrophobacterales bacterium]|nr:MmgE/PrpD family protein [Syntrophobacterales bacterium]